MHPCRIVNTDYIAVKFPVSEKVSLGSRIFIQRVYTNIEIRNKPGAAIDKFDTRNLSTGISFGYKLNPNIIDWSNRQISF